MKIILTGPNIRNDGSYVDAGTEIEVGDGGEQINADRADDLLAGVGRADEAPLELLAPVIDEG